MDSKTIELFKKNGIDAYKAIEKLKQVPVSLHCWQLDDVQGFETNASLSGGIQATGNYPYKARNFNELTQDLDLALSLIPGTKKINLHAIYRISDKPLERNEISYKEFIPWVKYAKERGLGLDYNPTLFSHPMVKNGLTLSSPHKEVRDYWIKHCVESRKVSEFFGKELNMRSLCNIWIPDGLKDNPSDRQGPRKFLKDSLDQILKSPIDKNYMEDSLESKLFGIGVESYTTGSHEVYLSYAMKNNLCCLLDTGHFHLSENVADKISSLLLFHDTLALHVSRPVRWDSDHVLRINDDLQEVANELVKCKALEKTFIGLDYFDASINRIAALVIGARNMQKCLLKALLTPWDKLAKLQNEEKFTELFVCQEELHNLPYYDVWEEYCKQENVKADETWFNKIQSYENTVLEKRGK